MDELLAQSSSGWGEISKRLHKRNGWKAWRKIYLLWFLKTTVNTLNLERTWEKKRVIKVHLLRKFPDRSKSLKCLAQGQRRITE